MTLTGKRVAQVDIKSNADLFYHLFKEKPQHLKDLTHKVLDCKLHEGEFGTVGSVIAWKYVYDGRYEVDKQIITDINEEKRLMSYKMIEGHLLEIYKYIQITFQVDARSDNNLVTWTIEYEKLDESFPDPNKHMEMFIYFTKDIEAGHLSLIGKRVAQIGFKSEANAFYDLWRHRANDIKKFSPKLVHACDLLEGDGSVGSLISWHYFLDGKNRVAKQIIADINDEKKLISFKEIEGDLMEQYKTMIITFHVEENEENLVKWTIEYERLDESVQDPDTLVEMFIKITKDIDAGI